MKPETTNTIAGFLNPYTVVEEFGLEKGMSVADFGSGAGHFSLAMANKVGRDGTVYAIDIRSSVLEVLEGHVKLDGLFQIQTINGNLEKEKGSTLPPLSQDRVLCSNILHQVDRPLDVLREAHRVLKKIGQLIVIDWLKDSKLGPPGRISKNEAEELSREAGFKKEREFKTGTHYGLIFRET